LSGWIKFWKDMADDPRLLSAASALTKQYHLGYIGFDPSAGDALRMARNALLGGLVTLWSYADTHIREDDTLPMTSDALDAFVGIDGFSELMPSDWVDKLDDGTVKLPGYSTKNDLIAKKKRAEYGKLRQARFRSKHQPESNIHAQRVTRNGAVTKCGDLDQDLSLDQDIKNQKKNPSASATPTQTALAKVPRDTTGGEWFLDFKLTYPSRAGDQGWTKAIRAANARIAEGHSPSEMVAGAARYAEYCKATGKLETEFVKQACTFLGPDKPFLQTWSLPATKAETRLSANLSAADEFMRRTGGTS
jgi:hypothetical protein